MRLPHYLSGFLPRLLIALVAILAACPASAAPALWVVRSPLTTVYLFGTVHMLPREAAWHSPVLDRALDSASEIWTEAEPGRLRGLVRLIRRYGLSDQTALHTSLPIRYRTRLEAQMSVAGFSMDQLSHVKPWLAEALLSDGAVKQGGFGRGVETELLEYAHRHHKATDSFETADEQFAILADMPVKNQLRALEMQIEGYPSAHNAMNPLVQAWLAGDVEKLDRMTNRQLLAQNERYFDDVIVRRNERFAAHIANRLQNPGTVFVAVGAAHLAGSTSIQYFLRQNGFTAERLDRIETASLPTRAPN